MRDSILSSASLHPDDTDPWVLRSTIVLPIPQIADPRLQSGGIVLPHQLAVRLDGSVAGDGCPFARGCDESDVDGVVGCEIISFAGLGVGVEEEVEAVCFLGWVLV